VSGPGVQPQTAAAQLKLDKEERDYAKRVELQEIADGSYGDNPMVRGLARDRLAALLNAETLAAGEQP